MFSDWTMRRWGRVGSLAWFYVFGALCIWDRGLFRIILMPVEYVGYITLAAAILGTVGFNIWNGGLFDRRLDHKVFDRTAQRTALIGSGLALLLLVGLVYAHLTIHT